MKQANVHFFAFLTILIWGSGFPFTRVIDGALSSYSIACIRCVLPAIVLLLLRKQLKVGKIKNKFDIVLFAIAGLGAYSANSLFFSLGLETLPSATASMVTSIAPILTSIGAWKLYGEKIKPIGWLCIATAFIGVGILLLWNGELAFGIGILWEGLYAIVFAVYNLLSNNFAGKGYKPMEIITYSAVFGAIEMIPFLPGTVTQVMAASTPAILAAVYLGLFPACIAYVFWNCALDKTNNTSAVTNWLFVNPLVAAILGFIMLREIPDMGTFIGGIIIIVSVIVFSTKGIPIEKE